MKTLVVMEQEDGVLNPLGLSAIAAASQMGGSVDVLIAGSKLNPALEILNSVTCIKTIFIADNEAFDAPLAETYAPLIAETGADHDAIFCVAGTFGKNIMPRVAALLEVAPITDVTRIIDSETFERPIYAGNAIATVKTTQAKNVMTIRATAFEPIGMTAATKPEIQPLSLNINNRLSESIKAELNKKDRPALPQAKLVISGGRGLQTQDNFDRLGKIADRMGAALGASRAAVDAGLAPNDCQVGQTGQVVAPAVYVAVGISGAIQHVAGMKDSKTILAINKDEDAPIFQVADFGLVADINDVLSEWEQCLTEAGK